MKTIKLNKKGKEFTGFKDVNGEEIYDGDFIGDFTEVDGKIMQSKQLVFWCDKRGCWRLDHSFDNDKSSSSLLYKELNDFDYFIIKSGIEDNNLVTVRSSLILWLITRTDDELSKIYVELNCWIWPEIIPIEFKPQWWDVYSGVYHVNYNNMDRKMGFSGIVMDYCESIAGKAKIKQYRNQNIDSLKN